jgi:hypothetical protein
MKGGGGGDEEKKERKKGRHRSRIKAFFSGSKSVPACTLCNCLEIDATRNCINAN